MCKTAQASARANVSQSTTKRVGRECALAAVTVLRLDSRFGDPGRRDFPEEAWSDNRTTTEQLLLAE